MFSVWIPTSADSLTDLEFVESPTTVISSLGKPVTLQCKVNGKGSEDVESPDVIWLKDGVPLEHAENNQYQLLTGSNSRTIISTLRIEKVQLPDMGYYKCAVLSGSNETFSDEGGIQLEGLPHFSVEPYHMTVVANVSFSLHCAAHGPPEPVTVIWIVPPVLFPATAQWGHVFPPSHLHVSFLCPGLNRTSTFSCEAQNRKGVATSRSGTITVLPDKPQDVRAVEITQSTLRLSWQPGFGGIYQIVNCSVQAKLSGESIIASPHQLIHNQTVSMPRSSHIIKDLEPHTLYAVRVACHSSQGPSDWSPWVELRTKEGVPENPPANVTAKLNGTEVLVMWEEPPGKLNGKLQGYMVEYSTPVVIDTGLGTEFAINLSVPLSNVSFRVCAYTGAGQGPWAPIQTLTLNVPGELKIASLNVAQSHLSLLFTEAFEPMMESGELVVRYRARRSYSRRTTEATLNSLGISDELKQKLQDVMVDRHKLTLGKTLGEGEFGSVMEGLLTQEEFVLKVAVKTMKIAICTRSEMEDFLREAACMKEFDHPNVMRLLGVCLQTVESEGYPSPVVILPYMKHGDLHSYLLYSRLGDCPVYLPSQMLVKFMTDIARGMEYLSNKNFIHRDLAARNCMLNENMNVCVADFGLSKKIYNGDYYRQGRISKMPVKWIAIESLADRVYTTKSDVWSFGVTMWEIATRGQTPYPGVENSEIYDYLRQGNRLKQPPDCLDSIYSLMFSCWLLSPKDRPSFESLRCELEKALEDLPDPQDPDEILYVNMDESSMELGAVGGRDPTGHSSPLCLKGLESVTTVEVHHPNRYVLCPQNSTHSWNKEPAQPVLHKVNYLIRKPFF
uniref:receptor protein-tyrosine kinase n=1 Tax=Oreochromis niloticus TaxID=8128 RepID=A0A669BG63_ORENI